MNNESMFVPAQKWTSEILTVFRGPIKGRACIGVIYTSVESAVLGPLERVIWEIQTDHEPHGLYIVLASSFCDGRKSAKIQIEAMAKTLNESET